MAPGSDRPIIVVGCARSGTTMVQLMLHAHPRIAIPPETRFVTEAYEQRASFGDLAAPASVDRLVDWIMIDPRQRLVHDLGLDVEEFRRRAHQVAPTVGSIVGLALQMYAERWGKPRWGDKRPSYFKRVDALLAMFPDAQLIHVIRDGRDATASLKEMSWWGSGAVGATRNWVEAMRFARWARRTLRADQYHELVYEELVADARGPLERCCAFLGEDFDEAMLEPQRMAREAVPERKRRRHHGRTTQAVSSAAVGRFQQDLTADELALFEAVAAPWLRERGYALSHARRPAPPLRLLARYARLSAAARWREARRALAERRARRQCPRSVAARLTSAQRAAGPPGA